MFDQKTKAILAGSGISTLIAILPVINLINFLFCAGYIFGGYMAVYFRERFTGDRLSLSEGALTGVLSGVVAAVIYTLITSALMQLVGFSQVETQMKEAFTQYGLMTGADAGLPPLAELFSFPYVLIPVLFLSLLYGFFSMIGGLIRTAQTNGQLPAQP
ncbi:MAG: hypothetical protein HUU10_01925 [Bacteroidetes bacterium]|nr:hypothetical protein [Bacteroidota bacterium]